MKDSSGWNEESLSCLFFYTLNEDQMKKNYLCLLAVTLGVSAIGSGRWTAEASAMEQEKTSVVSLESATDRVVGQPDLTNFTEVPYEEIPQWVHRALWNYSWIAVLVKAWVGKDGSYIVEYRLKGNTLHGYVRFAIG